MGKNVKGKIYGKYLNQAKYVIKGRKLKSPIAKLHKREITTGNYYRSVSEINKVKISISNDDKKITKVEPIETNIQSKASDGFEFIEDSINVKNKKVPESKVSESKIPESIIEHILFILSFLYIFQQSIKSAEIHLLLLVDSICIDVFFF